MYNVHAYIEPLTCGSPGRERRGERDGVRGTRWPEEETAPPAGTRAERTHWEKGTTSEGGEGKGGGRGGGGERVGEGRLGEGGREGEATDKCSKTLSLHKSQACSLNFFCIILHYL